MDSSFVPVCIVQRGIIHTALCTQYSNEDIEWRVEAWKEGDKEGEGVVSTESVVVSFHVVQLEILGTNIRIHISRVIRKQYTNKDTKWRVACKSFSLRKGRDKDGRDSRVK